MFSNFARILLLLLIVVAFSCKKTIEKTENFSEFKSLKQDAVTVSSDITCYDTLEPDQNADSLLVPTILGAQLVNNPYSVPVMQQASINLYGNANGIATNKKYVRFKPSSEDQLEKLDSLDLDLFDYPLDYEVIQEGDYYDQGLPTEEIPWYYTVVDSSFIPPPGIQYEVLANLYVPADDIYLENEAFRITGNPVESLDCGINTLSASTSFQGQIKPNVLECGTGYHWDYFLKRCVPDNCPDGYHWDDVEQQCVPDAPPPPPPPPPPPSTKIPSGQILVYDNAKHINVPVRQVRIVVKRFLKIDRTYTDDNGNFTSSKHFHNKVNIVVKFKNSLLETRGLRGARWYQMRFPIKHGIGKYSGNLNNLQYVFVEGTDTKKRIYRNWWAAQLMNAYREYNESATSLGTGTLPTNLIVLLTSWEDFRGSGSTPMNHHRSNAGSPPSEWIQFFLVSPGNVIRASMINGLQGGVLKFMDMSLGYNVAFHWSSDKVKELMYHEMTHAAHFQRVGQEWWNNLVYSEELTVAKYSSELDPYGNGSDGVASDYISLAESWAEYLGRVVADREYGVNSQAVAGASRYYYNDDPVFGLTSHLNYLEDYDPNDPNNPFRWIPEGLFYDMFDVRAENIPVVDNVSGFSNAEMFNALQSDVTSMPQYRERLITQNLNNQTNEVRNLFNQYHY